MFLPPYNFSFVKAERKGPTDMTTSQIIFYTTSRFDEREYEFDQDETKGLIYGPVLLRSIIQFSNDSWKVYHEKKFTGKAVHFRYITLHVKEMLQKIFLS